MIALATAALPLRIHRPRAAARLQRVPAVIRPAVGADVSAVHALIEEHAAEGRLLRRSASEIAAHIDRFVVATAEGRVVGCVDLAPLGGDVAEVRSLVVAAPARSNGVGRRLLGALIGRARAAGVARLCAFTHSPAYFVQAGFSIVPHTWVREKVERDCHDCAEFRRCGQHAVMLPLAGVHHSLSHEPVHG